MYNLSLDAKDLQQQKSPCEISKQLFQYLAFQFLKYMCFCFDSLNITFNYYFLLGDVDYKISSHCHAGLHKSV